MSWVKEFMKKLQSLVDIRERINLVFWKRHKKINNRVGQRVKGTTR